MSTEADLAAIRAEWSALASRVSELEEEAERVSADGGKPDWRGLARAKEDESEARQRYAEAAGWLGDKYPLVIEVDEHLGLTVT